VIGAVVDGVETILADSTVAPPQADTWYKLDVVVARVNGQDTVTLYANAGERVTWMRGSGPILTGGRVGVMARGGAAHDTDAETDATAPHLTASVASVAASVSGWSPPTDAETDATAPHLTASVASVAASVSGSVAPPQANTWHQLDIVVAHERVTLYVADQERVSWQPAGAHRLTGGQVGLMAKQSIAAFQELGQWDGGHPGPRSREVPRST